MLNSLNAALSSKAQIGLLLLQLISASPPRAAPSPLATQQPEKAFSRAGALQSPSCYAGWGCAQGWLLGGVWLPWESTTGRRFISKGCFLLSSHCNQPKPRGGENRGDRRRRRWEGNNLFQATNQLLTVIQSHLHR